MIASAAACYNMWPHVIRSNIRPHLKTRGHILYHLAHLISYGCTLNLAAAQSLCEMRPHLTKRGRMLVNCTDVLQECFSKLHRQCF